MKTPEEHEDVLELVCAVEDGAAAGFAFRLGELRAAMLEADRACAAFIGASRVFYRTSPAGDVGGAPRCKALPLHCDTCRDGDACHTVAKLMVLEQSYRDAHDAYHGAKHDRYRWYLLNGTNDTHQLTADGTLQMLTQYVSA